MYTLESTLVLHQEELPMGHRYYIYKSQEMDDKERNIIGGLYILQSEIGDNPPNKINISIEWK